MSPIFSGFYCIFCTFLRLGVLSSYPPVLLCGSPAVLKSQAVKICFPPVFLLFPSFGFTSRCLSRCGGYCSNNFQQLIRLYQISIARMFIYSSAFFDFAYDFKDAKLILKIKILTPLGCQICVSLASRNLHPPIQSPPFIHIRYP